MKNSAVITGLENVSFHSKPKERQCQRKLKLPHNYTHTLVEWRISHTSKVMLKILQVRLQQYMNVNFQMFKLDFKKAEKSDIKLLQEGPLPWSEAGLLSNTQK